MISSKELAKKLLEEVESGTDPVKLAEAIALYKDKPYLKDILPNVVKYLEKYKENIEQQKSFKIETAIAIKDSVAKRVEESLIGDRPVETKITLQPDLIAGFQVQHEDRFVDDSVSTRLNKIKESIHRI